MGVLGVLFSGCTFKGNDIPDTEIKIENNTIQNEINVPEEQTKIIEKEVVEEETVEAIDVVENTEEKSKRKVSVNDAKKFLKEKKSSDTVKVSAESVDKVEEVVEVENEVTVEQIDYSEKYDGAFGYAPSNDGNSFSTVPVKCNDLSSNPTLLALQAEVNPIFDADGAISEAFTLTPSGATVSYVGKAYATDCNVVVSEHGYTVINIYCNINDTCWRCLSTVMNELYDNGALFVETIKEDCLYGSSVYAAEDTWVEYNGLHTKVVCDLNDSVIQYYFK